MAQATVHYLTDDKQGSYCGVTGEFDVFMWGADDGPTTYCASCREGEPEWTHIEDDDIRRMML
jgi:hypothetical protein